MRIMIYYNFILLAIDRVQYVFEAVYLV